MADEEGEEAPKPYEFVGQRRDGNGTAEAGPRHGKGKATFTNGDVFTGVYYNGLRHGRGEYTWAGPKDPEKYPDGKWIQEGTTYRVRYVGQYVNNKKEGHGVMNYPDKGKFDGLWKNDKRHGQGTYYFPNGDIYTGEWSDGKKNGRGTYIFTKNGCQYVGEWKEGRIVSGTWVNKEYSRFTGQFDENNKPSGNGSFVFVNGNRQDGEYSKRPVAGAEEDEDGNIPQEIYWKGGAITKLTEPIKESEFMVY